tara:strand:- start:17455 stop:17769 length:315 start_codon:yes stop_codon:yes gene_type:complete
MGKQIKDIRIFDKGIASTVSEADINAEHASSSLNVEARSRLGLLSSTNKSSTTSFELRASDMISFKDKKQGTCILGFQSSSELSADGFNLGTLMVITDLYGDGE